MLKERSIVHRQQRFADVDAEVWVNADQVCIEGSVVNLRQWRGTIG
jgi:hypothetical protein